MDKKHIPINGDTEATENPEAADTEMDAQGTSEPMDDAADTDAMTAPDAPQDDAENAVDSPMGTAETTGGMQAETLKSLGDLGVNTVYLMGTSFILGVLFTVFVLLILDFIRRNAEDEK